MRVLVTAQFWAKAPWAGIESPKAWNDTFQIRELRTNCLGQCAVVNERWLAQFSHEHGDIIERRVHIFGRAP